MPSSSPLLLLPYEIRLQILRYVVDNVLIVLENPDWGDDVKSWSAKPSVWRTQHGVLATNHQLRREVLPIYDVKLGINASYVADNQYATKLSDTIKSAVSKVILSTEEWTRDLIWHDVFPRIKTLVTGSHLQATEHTISGVGTSGPGGLVWDVDRKEQGLTDVKTGRLDEDILENLNLQTGLSENWLNLADRMYPNRKFQIHCQNLVRIVKFEDENRDETTEIGSMVLYWDYDAKVVLERHWLSFQGLKNHDRFECLTQGYCSSCLEDGVSDRQSWYETSWPYLWRCSLRNVGGADFVTISQ